MKVYNKTTGKIEQLPNNISILDLGKYNFCKVEYKPTPNRRYYIYTDNVVYDEVLDKAIVDYIKTPKEVSEVIEILKDDVISKAKEYLYNATKKYSSAEMALWETLEKEAIAYKKDNTVVGNALRIEADMCGLSLEEFSTEVIENAENMKQFRALVVSTRYKKCKEIDLLSSIEDIILYENTPYEVEIDELGDNMIPTGNKITITKYKNNVTDWDIQI